MDLVKPGQLMGKLLEYAFTLQIENGMVSKEELRKKVIERLEQLKKKPG